jgi:hypothetical protein
MAIFSVAIRLENTVICQYRVGQVFLAFTAVKLIGAVKQLIFFIFLSQIKT